ncbi:MAG: hypothetical protein QOE92_2163, partial [Chloroflexota bacterium]|nr:hypothetical protein [Chloroflexota bacterium]
MAPVAEHDVAQHEHRPRVAEHLDGGVSDIPNGGRCPCAPLKGACNLQLLTRRSAKPVAHRNHCSEAATSQVRVHNFSISLDGFGTRDGLTFDAPFGHAG